MYLGKNWQWPSGMSTVPADPGEVMKLLINQEFFGKHHE